MCSCTLVTAYGNRIEKHAECMHVRRSFAARSHHNLNHSPGGQVSRGTKRDKTPSVVSMVIADNEMKWSSTDTGSSKDPVCI